VRPGELRYVEWSEIDFEKAEWSIPAEKMKMKQIHIVALPKQVIGILKDLQPYTGQGLYCFQA
jgi:integrase